MVQPGSHRSHGYSERLGDFGVGKLLGETQFKDLALEGREGFNHLARQLHPIVPRRSGPFLARPRSTDRLAMAPFPCGQAHMPGDPEKVSAQGTGLASPVQSLGHFQKGLLHEILRRLAPVAVAAREVARQVIRRVPEEALEISGLCDGVQGGWGFCVAPPPAKAWLFTY